MPFWITFRRQHWTVSSCSTFWIHRTIEWPISTRGNNFSLVRHHCQYDLRNTNCVIPTWNSYHTIGNSRPIQCKRTLLKPRHMDQNWRPTPMTDIVGRHCRSTFWLPTLTAYKIVGYSILITSLCITSRKWFKWRHLKFFTNVIIIVIKQYNYSPVFTIKTWQLQLSLSIHITPIQAQYT